MEPPAKPLYSRYTYAVARSSQRTMPNITPIEITHTEANTAQHAHSGHALYITGPSHIKRLPSAVAPNQSPWHIPCKCFGATFDTNDNPSGEISSSAAVRKK